MSIRELLEGPTGRILRDLEEQERMRRLVCPDGPFNELAHVYSVHDQLRAVLGPNRSLVDFVAERQGLLDTYKNAIDAAGGPTALRRLADQATGVGDVLGQHPIGSHADAFENARSMIAILGVSDVLAEDRYRALGAFARPERDALAAIGAAASHFEALSAASSFARVGSAMAAAEAAFASNSILGAAYNDVIDPFFGDWTRVNALPDEYGADIGARREIVREIDADEALLDVETEEAAALIDESAVDENGAPVLVFGRPSGIIVADDPARAAFALISETERRYRARVARVMSAAFGASWLREKHPELAKEWAGRREEDEKEGLPVEPLIQYSTFYELNGIVTSHWTVGFAGDARKPRQVTAPFSALNPHRRHTMHSRLVTPEQLVGIWTNIRKIEPWLMADAAQDGEDEDDAD